MLQTLGVVLTTFMLLAMHPDVQKRAQGEIEQVIGAGRLPDFEDRERLIYVNAVLKEVARMYQVLPLGRLTSLPSASDLMAPPLSL